MRSGWKSRLGVVTDGEESQAVVRRFAVVMNADVVGYCKLMASDELATVSALLRSQRRIARIATAHGGRVVDAPGDNALVTFGCCASALACALDIQELGTGNDTHPIQLRIGIHAGEVLALSDRVYGEVVNIAARLQAEAPPGGTLVSQAVAVATPGRAYDFQPLGELHLRNIPEAVPAARVRRA